MRGVRTRRDPCRGLKSMPPWVVFSRMPAQADRGQSAPPLAARRRKKCVAFANGAVHGDGIMRSVVQLGMKWIFSQPLPCAALAFATVCSTSRLEAADAPAPAPPRLAVVISIDQCRADYLERFRPYF